MTSLVSLYKDLEALRLVFLADPTPQNLHNLHRADSAFSSARWNSTHERTLEDAILLFSLHQLSPLSPPSSHRIEWGLRDHPPYTVPQILQAFPAASSVSNYTRNDPNSPKLRHYSLISF